MGRLVLKKEQGESDMQIMKKLGKALRNAAVGTFAVLALVGVAWADYPTQDIISLNISNDSSYKMSGSGETATLAGTLPDNAWQNTSNADRTGTRVSGDARNGYRNGVAAWDGASQSVTNLAGVVFTWAVEGSGTANYGSASRSPTFQGAWLARASGEQTDAALELQNIPYEKYDVIVYLSGDTSDATTPAFRAVCVNGIPYVGDTSASGGTARGSAVMDTWGTQQTATELGKNALKISGLTSDTLVLTMRKAGYLSGSSKKQGISAVQIVRDMSAVGENTRPVSSARVISVNLQSAYSSVGEKPEYYGLERVPANAWTEDGCSSASSSGADITANIKEWDGAAQEVNVLSGITINEKAANGWNWKSDYVPMYHLVNAYLDDGGDRARITVTGVPYKEYDVIVYTATDSSENKFGPVTVNGTPYRWSASNGTTQQASSSDTSSSTYWGFSRSRVPAYGANALRITGQTSSTLTIKGGNNNASARGGIAGFQIVDTYDPSAIQSVTIEDGGTLELSAAQETALRVICEGSLTVVGVNDYTVTNADLLKLDLDAVTGTVTLGANTCYALDASRTLPAGYLFGEGSAVAITETAEEYAKDEFSVSGLTGVSTVVLTRYDGTTVNLTVTDGSASRGDGTDVKVTGAAAYYEFTFDNTLSTSEGSRHSATMQYDHDPEYYELAEGGTGVGAQANPYVSVASGLPTWSEFSIVVVGSMPSEAKKVFVSFGSTTGSNKSLFLATDSVANKVIVAYGNQSSSEILTTLTVPHAAEARHFYAFTVSENKRKMTIYLDGMKWKTVTSASGFQIGTTSHSGVQGGSAYGGVPAGYGRASDGVFDSLLIYDYPISDAQMEALKDLYPYSPSAGSYSRAVSGETTFATEANTWTKAGEAAANYAVPADGAAMTLTAGPDATVAVNATLSADSLNLEGDGALTLKKGDGRLTSAGLTTIATDVTIEGGAADISGAPTVITEGGSLCFDYSEYDLLSYTGTSLIPLTGEIDEQGQGVVTCRIPAGDFTHEHTSEFLYTNGCYQLLVTCREGRDVYLPAGTTNFADDTVVKYFVEVPVDPEVQGDPEIVTNECYAIAADTVHFLFADTVTVARTTPVAGYAFGDYAGTLVFAPGQEELVLSAAITGTGKVEVSSGAVQSRGSIATDIDVDAGAVLKLGSVGGFGATGGGTTPSGKAITVTGTVELNGVRDSCNAYTLNGGTLRNTGAEIPTGSRQTTALTLTANSTVHAGSDFGLVGSGYAATSLELGGYTLAKTGDAKFWLYNTRSTGAGTVDIQAGSVYAYSTVNMPNVGFNIAEGATLKVRTDDFDAGTLSGSGAVDLYTYRPSQTLEFAAGSSLAVTITLASTTESLIEIPYTGTPNSVTVFGTDGTSADPAATVSYEDGKIVVRVDVANLSRTNPVTGESQTFTYAFFGTADADWKTLGNWKTAAGNRWADVTGTIPARPSSDKWDPVLLDGDLVAYTAGEDGYKSVSVSTLEGWELKVACLNGVKLTATTVNKHQNGCWYWIDETSKLVLGTKGSGNNSSNVDLYVAAKEGINFNSDFDFNSCTVKYNFKGDGSAVYSAGPTKGTHQIRRVILPKGNDQTRLKKLITRKLVSFPKGGASVTFGTDSMDVTSLDTTLTMTAYSGEGNLTTESDFGTYQLTQASDGVYIKYVGYGKPFTLRLR